MICVHVVHITTPCCTMQPTPTPPPLGSLGMTERETETATLPQNKGFLGGINWLPRKKSKERDGERWGHG